jgi:hypothetical protein
MSDLTKRLDALERQAVTLTAAGGRSRELLAEKLEQLATRTPALDTGAESPAQRVVAEALNARDFWPAVVRGLRRYLKTRAA